MPVERHGEEYPGFFFTDKKSTKYSYGFVSMKLPCVDSYEYLIKQLLGIVGWQEDSITASGSHTGGCSVHCLLQG